MNPHSRIALQGADLVLACLAIAMAVVSMSLPEPLVDEMDRTITVRQEKGRSAFIRRAIRNELAAHLRLEGHCHGSVTIVYPHDKESKLSDVRHAFHDVVLSLMHTHCEPEICMDVMIVGGPGERIQQLLQTLQSMRDVERSQFVQTR